MQFRARQSQYAEAYPTAQTELILINGEAVGELIVDRSPNAVRIVNVTVVEAQRGAGIGSTVLREEIESAARVGIPVRLSVWSDNIGARRLYERLGFEVTTERNGYLEMQQVNATEGCSG
jgi:ribosomal protein S18 acetylase RimI-like enzyme